MDEERVIEIGARVIAQYDNCEEVAPGDRNCARAILAAFHEAGLVVVPADHIEDIARSWEARSELFTCDFDAAESMAARARYLARRQGRET